MIAPENEPSAEVIAETISVNESIAAGSTLEITKFNLLSIDVSTEEALTVSVETAAENLASKDTSPETLEDASELICEL